MKTNEEGMMIKMRRDQLLKWKLSMKVIIINNIARCANLGGIIYLELAHCQSRAHLYLKKEGEEVKEKYCRNRGTIFKADVLNNQSAWTINPSTPFTIWHLMLLLPPGWMDSSTNNDAIFRAVCCCCCIMDCCAVETFPASSNMMFSICLLLASMILSQGAVLVVGG